MNELLATADPSHGVLLAQFPAAEDQSAFAELLRRLGPMVQAAGERILNDHHAARNVTQAVFFVLARKAALRKEPSVAGWLYTVNP